MVLLMADLCFVLASATLEGVGSQISDGYQPTEVADVDAIGIGGLEQALVQELSSSVGNLTISLHLTKTKTTIPGMKEEVCVVCVCVCVCANKHMSQQ